jgi:hypothetical protein
MDESQFNLDVLSSWTDALNHVLDPLDILLSGVDAASILPKGATKTAYQSLRAYGEDDFVLIAERANQYCETDQIRPEQIREAVRRTLGNRADR